MKIIAKTGNSGVLIEATEAEVKEILKATSGNYPKEVNIGDKIPAIDYATTIIKIKQLNNNVAFENLLVYTKKLTEIVNEYKEIVEATKNIEVE